MPQAVPAIDKVLGMGCWSEVQTISLDAADASSSQWHATSLKTDNASFEVIRQEPSAEKR